jgi:hypothetical protein
MYRWMSSYVGSYADSVAAVLLLLQRACLSLLMAAAAPAAVAGVEAPGKPAEAMAAAEGRADWLRLGFEACAALAGCSWAQWM